MRKSVLLLAVLATLLLSPAAALPAPGQPRELVVGVENQDYRPYYWVEAGRYQGPGRDILDAYAASRGDIRFVYRPLPVNRLYQAFLSGAVDLKYPDNPQWQADLKKGKAIAYSRAIADFIDGVMVQPRRKGAGLDGLKVLGTVLGFTPWDYLGRIKAGSVRLLENGSLSGLLEQTILGRIDGAYVNPAVARYQLENVLHKPGALVFDPELPHTKGAYLASSIKHPDLIKDLNRYLSEERESVWAILRRYNLAD